LDSIKLQDPMVSFLKEKNMVKIKKLMRYLADHRQCCLKCLGL